MANLPGAQEDIKYCPLYLSPRAIIVAGAADRSPLGHKDRSVASVAAPGSHRARTVDWAIPPEADEPASNKDGRKEKQ